MINVLWLASWYPGRADAYDGDFIERHALAVSRFAKITLLFLSKDETLKNKAVEIEKTFNSNIIIYKVYYGRSGWDGILEQFFSYRKYTKLQKKLYCQIVLESGIPSIVHVQVAMKAGLLALWLKKRYNIPFIVTEHWSGYYPDIRPNVYSSNWFIKMLNKKIIRTANMFLPVSNNLGEIVNQHLTNVPYTVVPNCVNTEMFYFNPTKTERFRFIHVSSMIDIKNPIGILKACKIIKEKGYNFELKMIGNQPQRLLDICCQFGIEGHIIFEAVIPYSQVAKEMQQSSAFILFSHFENLPCVLLEALCCGLPVIGTRVGGIPELINNKNGILVEKGNIPELSKAMIQMIENYNSFNREAISKKSINLYNYDTIGKQYEIVYKKITGKF